MLGFSRQAYYQGKVVRSDLEDHVIRLADSNLSKARYGCPSQGCRRMYETFGNQFPLGVTKAYRCLWGCGTELNTLSVMV